MTGPQHSQTKNTRKYSSTFSSASTGGMFESRPFVVQASRGENVQQPDLKTSMVRAERYGHHLSQIQPFGNEATTAVQPKMETGQPIQCAGGFNISGIKKGQRPDKPERLKGTDQNNQPLTAHHKYGLNKINQDLNSAVIGHPDPSSTTQGQNILNWADPTNSKNGNLSYKQVAWTDHNAFKGPLPENRLDDPGNVSGAKYPELDTHFTASGTVTPASELALHVHKAGGIHQMNPSDLRARLNALPNPNQASPYNPNEWVQPTPGKYQQAGMPSGWHNQDINDRINYAEQSQIDSARRRLFN